MRLDVLSNASEKTVSTIDRVERRWTKNIYHHITVITHGGRVVKASINRPGMSLEFSCPEGNNKIFDEAIEYMLGIRSEIPPEPEYKKVADEVPAD